MLRIGSRFAAMLFLSFAAAGNAATPVADLALLDDRQLPLVQATFGGSQTIPCMIDLGAQFNTMPVALGGKVGVEGPGAFTSDGAGITRFTRQVSATVRLNADTSRRLRFYLRDIRLDGVDGPYHVCILGQPYIREFTWDIDGPAGRLRLWPRKTPTDVVAGQSSRFRMRDGFVTMPVVLDGVTAQAFVDTGAGLSEINRRLQSDLGIGTDDPRLGAPRGIVTLHRMVRESPTVRLRGIVIAGFPIDDPEPMLQLTDSFLARFFGRGTPAMLLGWDILVRSRVVIDWSGRTVAVTATEPRLD